MSASGITLAQCKACRHAQEDSELYPWTCEDCGVRHAAANVYPHHDGGVLHCECRSCGWGGWVPPVTGDKVSSVWACWRCGVLHAVPTSGEADEPRVDVMAADIVATSIAGDEDVFLAYADAGVITGVASYVLGFAVPKKWDDDFAAAGWLAAAALANGDASALLAHVRRNGRR